MAHLLRIYLLLPSLQAWRADATEDLPDWLQWVPEDMRPTWPEELEPEVRLLALAGLLLFTACLWLVVVCLYCRRKREPLDDPEPESPEPPPPPPAVQLHEKCGVYTVIFGTKVKSEKFLDSEEMGSLTEGQEVEVLEMWQLQNRVRAKIQTEGGRPGWVSVRSTDGKHIWLAKKEDQQTPAIEFPSYWENWQMSSAAAPSGFEEIYEVLREDATSVQGLFDDWAHTLRIGEADRMKIIRVERNENSHLWTRYAEGKIHAAARANRAGGVGADAGHERRPSTLTHHYNGGNGIGSRRSTNQVSVDTSGLTVHDYANDLPMSALDAGINETYLFHRCSFEDVKQICANGSLDRNEYAGTMMRFVESPYDLESEGTAGDEHHGRHPGSLDAQRFGRPIRLEGTCDGMLLLGPMACAGPADDWQVLMMFRVTVGANPLRWTGSLSSINSALDKENATVAVHSRGSGMPRCFYTARRELSYPEYIIYYHQRKADLHELTL